MSLDYDTLVLRNAGYVAPDNQERIRKTRLLIAGCGIGSSPAVCAARMGFEHFVLVDGDTVEAHNLNRQFYDFADVGRPKVEALRDAILRINPGARVEAIRAYLDESNTREIVARADIVFDTIDFLDLPAILRVHSSARSQGIPVLTALSVGFGALVWLFPGDGPVSLADILAPEIGETFTAQGSTSGRMPSYAEVFERFVQRLVPHLDEEVVEQIGKVLRLMKDGKTCPASQVAVGSFAIGAMATSMIHDLLAGNPVPVAPRMVIHSFRRHESRVVDIAAT